MNVCVLSGKLSHGPAFFGGGKVIKFSLATRYSKNDDDTEDGINTVPCVIFDPHSELKSFFEDKKVVYCRGVGRVSRSSYEDKNGNKVFSTEVIFDPKTVMVKTG